ncbi:unnamed protein product [Prorocentrum cordatum]|uniref:Uncharacterized protein n=1 Tax=Prorocentrum cordatum TaxID=2364126 RepID=A0ABN9SC51_9DINO|nr:unnamed protein product [Polarella glacialis]
MGVPGVSSSSESWADYTDKGKGKDTAAADPWAAGAQKLAAIDLPAQQRKMADLSVDPISNWRTVQHVMKMAACKARDTITSVSASEIKPFESRNEDPQIIAEARALTLRSIASVFFGRDMDNFNDWMDWCVPYITAVLHRTQFNAHFCPDDQYGHYEEGLGTLARGDGKPMITDERQQVTALKATLHSNIAQCMLSLELFRRAADAATECLKLDEAHAKALHRRSQAHEALREWEEALRDALRLRELGGGGLDPEALGSRCDALFEKQAKENQAVNKVVNEQEKMMKMKGRFETAFKKHGLYEADAAPEIARWLVAHDDLPFTVDKIAEKWKMSKIEAEDIAKWISKGIELGVVPRPEVVK